MSKKSKATKSPKVTEAPAAVPLKLDLGCGKNKVAPDFIAVDSLDFPGVDLVLDLTAKESSVQNADFSVTHVYKKWPWADNSVDEIHASHFMEHLKADERIHFINELYRVLKPGCSAKVIVPHWASCRAYGDLTHAWPPVSEFFFYYLSKEWRDSNAPHNTDYNCNFAATWGYSLNPALLTKNQEHQSYALANFKEAAQDIISTLTKA
jgi:SAM-dependent methyltransferase